MSAAARTPDDYDGLLVGRYELVAELASGGMATVYLARAWGEAGFERWCAIKKLHPHLANEREYVEMFIDEARVAGGIHHPNVVETLAAGRDDLGSHFLVMQYVAGQHLGALLREVTQSRRRIPAPLVLRIGLDALAGLSAAHALRDGDGQPLELVHRDISPHNILVGADGLARLTDFGIAKAEGRLHATRSNVVKGKLAYMSPEQLSGKPLDQRADVFAMGIVIWEALTHRRLFASDDPAEIFRRVLHAPIPLPSSVRRELRPLDAVLAKALSRDRDERYASAAELARALEQAAPGVGGVASARAVAKLVGLLAEDKLEAERRYIDDAAPEPRVSHAPARRSHTETRELRRVRAPVASTSEEAPVAAQPPPLPGRRYSLLSAALVLIAATLVPLLASDRGTPHDGQEPLARVARALPRRDPGTSWSPTTPASTRVEGESPAAVDGGDAIEVGATAEPHRARQRPRSRRGSGLEPGAPSDPELRAPPNPYLPESP